MIRIKLVFLLSLSMFGAGVACGGSPAGKWRGGWASQSTGHSGPMRARIRPLDHDSYRAWFAGRFAGVVPFVYPAKLHRVPGTCSVYQSSQRLPLLGTYRMTARVTPHRFQANFRSRRDRGTFFMTRR